MAHTVGFPLHRENKEKGKWQKKSLPGKHRKFGNLAKTQRILYLKVVYSLIPKYEGYEDICREICDFLNETARVCKVNFIYKIGAGKILWFDRENTNKLKMKFEKGP